MSSRSGHLSVAVERFPQMFRALFGKIGGRGAPAAAATAPALVGPIRLSNGTLTFSVGVTTRREIEQRIGPAIGYPAPGWQTWTVSPLAREPWILSAFYKDNVLVGVEHYVAKSNELPAYAPRIKGTFRLVPDDVALGNRLGALPDHYVAAAGLAGGVRAVVYQHLFAARWATGIALIAGNDGRVERLALYANLG